MALNFAKNDMEFLLSVADVLLMDAKGNQLASATLKSTKAGNLSNNDRKRLYKFIVGNLLKSISNEGEDLTKEEEDYMVEWDYNNSDKCGW